MRVLKSKAAAAFAVLIAAALIAAGLRRLELRLGLEPGRRQSTPTTRRPGRRAGGIPQNNGGDQDGDNNGGPSDGDGNI